MSLIFSAWTVVVFLLFIGIVIWAWSGKRKPEFDAAARIPLEDDDDEVITHDEESPHA
ncbi:MAG: cbb3-type cytochrome c oxidase subunit 3 [Thiotrichales bacterium]|nr:cbb3-type cytochrome c oxidase subunit 3 [Thiotrichales bacterium]